MNQEFSTVHSLILGKPIHFKDSNIFNFWKINLSSNKAYDVIIIGTGQSGAPLANYLANKGQKVAIIEKDQVGGTCVNWGCTPTKTLYASARVAHIARRASEYGVTTDSLEVDFSKVMARKDEVVKIWHDGSVKRLSQNNNINLYYGEGSFLSKTVVQVRIESGEKLTLEAPRIFINTGGRARVTQIPGLESNDYLDNKKILGLKILPKHLLILGGGYIGLEFGQMFHRFGSQVTVINRGDRLLSREDPDISEAVRDVLQEEGLEILFQSSIEEIKKLSENEYSFTIIQVGQKKEIIGSHLLIAIGREPNSDMLNLNAVGVETDSHGFIKATDKLETTSDGIYVLGDVKGGPAFTHISYDDYRIVRDNLYEERNKTIYDRSVPNVVFIDPQLGSVGLNETEAKKKNIIYDLYKMNMSSIARAFEMSEEKGFLKVLVNPQDQTILGATVFGFEGGELMNMLQIAMEAKFPITKLQEDVFAHPTLAEGFNNLFTYYKIN